MGYYTATMETWAVAVAASAYGAVAGAGEATDVAPIVPVTVEDTDLLAFTEYLKIYSSWTCLL